MEAVLGGNSIANLLSREKPLLPPEQGPAAQKPELQAPCRSSSPLPRHGPQWVSQEDTLDWRHANLQDAPHYGLKVPMPSKPVWLSG